MKVSYSYFLAVLVSLASALNPDPSLSVPKNLVPGTPITDWKLTGDAAVSDVNKISLTKLGQQNQAGSLWASKPNNLETWTLDIDFDAGGLIEPSGGMALFYTPKELTAGNSHGSQDSWEGLAIIVDSQVKNMNKGGSNNDDHVGAVQAFINDGTKKYSDIRKDPEAHAVSLCQLDYRNTGYPTKLKVSYAPGLFRILVNNQLCLQTDKITLPKGGYFGISSGGTGVTDSFVISRLETFLGIHPSVEEIDAKVMGTSPRKQESQEKHQNTPQENQQTQQNQQKQQNQNQQNQQNQQQTIQTRDHTEDLNKIISQLDDVSKKSDRLSREAVEKADSNTQKIISDLKTELNSFVDSQQQVQNRLERKIDVLESVLKELIQLQRSSADSKSAETRNHISGEMDKVRVSVNDIAAALQQHTSSLGSLPESLQQAVTKGGSSFWLAFTLFVMIQGVLFVGYLVYKSRKRSYHAKIL